MEAKGAKMINIRLSEEMKEVFEAMEKGDVFYKTMIIEIERILDGL